MLWRHSGAALARRRWSLRAKGTWSWCVHLSRVQPQSLHPFTPCSPRAAQVILGFPEESSGQPVDIALLPRAGVRAAQALLRSRARAPGGRSSPPVRPSPSSSRRRYRGQVCITPARPPTPRHPCPCCPPRRSPTWLRPCRRAHAPCRAFFQVAIGSQLHFGRFAC